MNLVSRFFTGMAGGLDGMVRAFKDADYSIYKPWEWLHLIGTMNSSSGEKVNMTTAMQLSTVYACVRVIAEDLAKVGLHMYHRNDDGTVERAAAHPVEFVLNETANGYQTSFSFREMQEAFLLLRGNAYAYKVRSLAAGQLSDGKGQIVELVPIHPDRVEVRLQTDGVPYFMISPPRNQPGSPKRFTQDEIWHISGLSFNGYTGITPIEYQAELLGFSLSQMKYGSRLMRNGARPGGLLKHPGKLKQEGRDRLKGDWDKQFGGEGQGSTAVLEEGMEWQPLGMKNVDAQYLETMGYTRSQIAAIFRVPPHKVGDLEHATFSNIEHQAIEYVTDCLLGWATRWEKAIAFGLIDQPKFYYAEHLLETLLRGDLKTRYEAYQIGRQGGWLNADEIRRKENMNPIEGGSGDKYWRPSNMVFSDTPAVTKQQPPPTDAVKELADAFKLLGERNAPPAGDVNVPVKVASYTIDKVALAPGTKVIPIRAKVTGLVEEYRVVQTEGDSK